ncbi:MAG TPA: sugar phosphate isomerase/epimerase [Chthonomonadaceae bacterium]|nr:sugar phosphate isomerase/epimerase [Chthonomonadaceae bacterium]
MTDIPVALQLYSVREDAAKDLAGVLKQVAGMGYDGVEFAGYYGHSAADVRKMLDDNGLKCCGGHLGLDTLLGDALNATIEYQRTLGNIYLIVPGFAGSRTSSKAAWLETAGTMNEIAARLKPHGMFTGYHNHHTEFHQMDGELPWDIFFGNTSRGVIMQFDTGNALVGGAEAGPFLRRYPGRAITVHLKEHSATNDKALIGEGDVNWPEIFSLCEGIGGTKWYIVEQESYAYSPLECAARCREKVKEMGR